MLARLLRTAWALHRVTAGSPIVTDGPLAEAAAEIALELRVQQRVRLHVGSVEAMPMVWGIVRAHLLLPARAVEWPAERLRAVLLHELAHLRRRDPLALAIAQLARAIHWFNPLAWVAVHRLRVEQERACDDYVLRAGVKPSEYASHVLDIATNFQPAASLSSAALAMADATRLESRLLVILDAARNRRSLSGWRILSILLFAAAVAFPLAMLRAADSRNEAKPNDVRAAPEDAPRRREILSEEGHRAGKQLDELKQRLAVAKTQLALLNLLTIEQHLERELPKEGQAPSLAKPSSTKPESELLPSQKGYQRAKFEIWGLEARRAQLLKSLRPKHPLIAGLEGKIAEQEGLLQFYREKAKTSFDADREVLQSTIRRLQAEITEVEAEILAISRELNR